MESYYCYDLTDRATPGPCSRTRTTGCAGSRALCLENTTGSDGIARIAEFLATDSPKVIAYGFPSPLLRKMGELQIIDELRVIIAEHERTTAYFTFSSQDPAVAASVPDSTAVGTVSRSTTIRTRSSKAARPTVQSDREKFAPPLIPLEIEHLGNFPTM